MFLQSPREHRNALVGSESIWKYLDPLVRATRVSRRFTCGFQTKLHLANVSLLA